MTTRTWIGGSNDSARNMAGLDAVDDDIFKDDVLTLFAKNQPVETLGLKDGAGDACGLAVSTDRTDIFVTQTGQVASLSGSTKLPLSKAIELTTLSVPGAHDTAVAGMSKSGAITGSFDPNPDFGFSGGHAFVLRDGTFTTIDVPGASRTFGAAINGRGELLLQADFQSGGTTDFRYVLDDNGAFTTLAVPGADRTQATGLNDRGEIVGFYNDSIATHGFLDHRGAYSIVDVPGGTGTTPSAINGDGVIIGTFSAGGSGHGFVDDHGTFATIDLPDAYAVYPTALNEHGQVVGYDLTPQGQHGFVWQNGATVAVFGVDTIPAGIDDRGRIAGTEVMTDSLGTRAYVGFQATIGGSAWHWGHDFWGASDPSVKGVHVGAGASPDRS